MARCQGRDLEIVANAVASGGVITGETGFLAANPDLGLAITIGTTVSEGLVDNGTVGVGGAGEAIADEVYLNT